MHLPRDVAKKWAVGDYAAPHYWARQACPATNQFPKRDACFKVATEFAETRVASLAETRCRTRRALRRNRLSIRGQANRGFTSKGEFQKKLDEAKEALGYEVVVVQGESDPPGKKQKADGNKIKKLEEAPNLIVQFCVCTCKLKLMGCAHLVQSPRLLETQGFASVVETV